MRHAVGGLLPAAKYSISCRRFSIGVPPPDGGADIRPRLPRSLRSSGGWERRGRMSNSHASTRLVHGVQLPVSHTGGGERKRSDKDQTGALDVWESAARRGVGPRQSPTLARQQASAAQPPASAPPM